jgi:hypothetical protein
MTSSISPNVTGSNYIAANNVALDQFVEETSPPLVNNPNIYNTTQTTGVNPGNYSQTLNIGSSAYANPNSIQSTQNNMTLAQVHPSSGRPRDEYNSESGGINSHRTREPMTAHDRNAIRPLNSQVSIGTGADNKQMIQVTDQRIPAAKRDKINQELREAWQEKLVDVRRDKALFTFNDLVQAGVAIGSGLKGGGGWGGVIGGLGSANASLAERDYDITSAYRDQVNSVLDKYSIPKLSMDQVRGNTR